jgi:hypothetical protein
MILPCLFALQAHILLVRFRDVPTFGRNTIRRFKNDVSAMQGLAGRDYEDILQVYIDLLMGCILTKMVSVPSPALMASFRQLLTR